VSLSVGLEHSRVDGRGDLPLLVPFARGMVAAFTRATRADRLQFPEMNVNAQNGDAHFFRRVSMTDWEEFEFHSGRQYLPIRR
jgi:hypothetical protein